MPPAWPQPAQRGESCEETQAHLCEARAKQTPHWRRVAQDGVRLSEAIALLGDHRRCQDDRQRKAEFLGPSAADTAQESAGNRCARARETAERVGFRKYVAELPLTVVHWCVVEGKPDLSFIGDSPDRSDAT